MDLVHQATQFVDRNRYLALGVALALLLIGAMLGCAVKTQSLAQPDRRVTASELEREVIASEQAFDARRAQLTALQETYNADVAAFNRSVDLAKADLKAKQEMRAQVIDTVGGLGAMAVQGAISPATGLSAGIQLLTLFATGGLLADNRRKDKVIAERSAHAPEPSEPQTA